MLFIGVFLLFCLTAPVKYTRWKTFLLVTPCSGILSICSQELFHPQELRAMVVGNENYDFHEMEKVSDYLFAM